jgi:hypothetical protein
VDNALIPILLTVAPVATLLVGVLVGATLVYRLSHGKPPVPQFLPDFARKAPTEKKPQQAVTNRIRETLPDIRA